MAYDFEITLDLNERDVRVYIRDSLDLLGKHLRDINSFSAKRGRIVICKFYEYGYPQEWKRIMFNLWNYWEVKNYEEFTSKVDELTDNNREKMIEEIAKAEVVAILREQN